ncbi:signal peptidase [Colletotrichum incanum]|uniref:Signal peptidase complex catalytic subunit SEC11 n=1 Tax=Colletotrichum incanum TaxID=1573173 RepID=A0A167C778_COLIC|nr:signal peptidase [Colletotrichum incanum]
MRAALASALPILRPAATLYMAWKLLCLVINSPYPAMVVLTDSMMPAFQPGDVILLSNQTTYVVDGRQLIRTKGDNNEIDDVALYAPGQTYVYRGQIIGLVRGYLPRIGLLTIAIGKLPWLKEAVLAVCMFLGLVLQARPSE